jgi:hypothetical protein
VSPVRYELGYIPEDGILHSHRRENLKSYISLTGRTLYRRRNVSPLRYELGFCVPEDGILQYIKLVCVYRRKPQPINKVSLSPVKNKYRLYIEM